jgi:hypothetical protein
LALASGRKVVQLSAVFADEEEHLARQSGEEARLQHLPDSARPAALAYSQLVFANVFDWYKSADAKAQIILTLDGALVAFLTTSVFKNPADLSEIAHKFTAWTWVLLISMCLCLAGSIMSALACLWSRVFLLAERDTVLVEEKKRIKEGPAKYSPNVMLFFKTICWLEHDKFQEQLGTTDAAFHIKAFASQAYLLSKRVYAKHMWVNAGFVLAGVSLILFLASGVSYLVALK